MTLGPMQRRAFLTLLGGAATAWPRTADAQPTEPMRRIGVLLGNDANDPEAQRRVANFLKGLQDLGWFDGRNVRIDYRWGGDDSDRIKAYAAELVGLKPDVILAGSALALQPLQRATRTIPLVFVSVADPVAGGFVASLAHPGGNVTGFTPAEYSMAGKWLETLREIAPAITRAAIILNPQQIPQIGLSRVIEAAAPSLGVQVTVTGLHDATAIERAITNFAQQPNGGLIVLPNPVTTNQRALIISLAAKHRLPAIYAYRFFVADGGLVSYGVDPASQFQQAATYVDRILRGTKPADLPVQQPTKFEMAINLKTAKALGLTVPVSLLARADEVIE